MGGGRREKILAAATELAADAGLSAVTVRAVAARAGIGASTLRHYFPTQRQLHEAVITASLDAQLDDRRIADTTIDPGTRLTECLAQLLPERDDRIHELEAWMALQASARSEGPQAPAIDMLTRRALTRIDDWLALLEKEGALLPEPREHHLATALVTVDGLALGLYTAGVVTSVAQARRQLDHIVRHAIVAANPAASSDR